MIERLLGRRDAFANFAWCFVVYLLGVILFGAWVRITGSGAGCGDHWPTCHGQVIPRTDDIKTMIEYTHRLTSGLCGIFGLVMIVWAYIKHRKGKVFLGATLTMVFILLEALIGAGIVLRELVADNDSVARAIVISLHLVNTLILMAAASLTAWWASDTAHGRRAAWRADEAGPVDEDLPASTYSLDRVLLFLGALLIIATCMSGAVTALGDTLFPVDPTIGQGLMARVRDDLSATRHFLVRLRILHPIIAVVSAAALIFIGNRMLNRAQGNTRSWALALCTSVALQVLVGLVNIALAAPAWVQLLHLLTAQLVWISLVLLAASSSRISSAEA